jgi:hypothetical protein
MNEYNTVRTSQCSVGYNNNTKNARYNFSTSTGETVNACLTVYDYSTSNQYIKNQTCVLSSSGTILIPLNDTTRSYGLGGTLQFSDNTNPFPCGTIVMLEANKFTINGSGLLVLVIDVMIFCVLVGIGLWNPIIAIVMGLLSVTVLFMTSFYNIGIASFVGIIAIGGIIMYRMKQGWG